MSKNISSYLDNIPFKITFDDIDEFERFEERFFEVIRYFGDIVGMGVGYVELCPNFKPPDYKGELLPWLWLIHPQLKEAIIGVADDRLKQLISEYN
jgi:hypothetical protein